MFGLAAAGFSVTGGGLPCVNMVESGGWNSLNQKSSMLSKK